MKNFLRILPLLVVFGRALSEYYVDGDLCVSQFRSIAFTVKRICIVDITPGKTEEKRFGRC